MRIFRVSRPWRWRLDPNVFGRVVPSGSSHDTNARSLCCSAGLVKKNGGDETLPVLIVGAGPVGLILSILLTKLGVGCTVVEKGDSFSDHPQAHFINNRSMELFRRLDGLGKDILELQPAVNLWRKFIYCTSLSGQIIGSVDHMKPQDFEQIVSPTSVGHFSQYKLLRLLLKRLLNMGFHIFTADRCNSDQVPGGKWEKKILTGHECKSFSLTDDGIMVKTSFHKEGKLVEKIIPCRILIGADGARSTVRKLVGIDMEGERNMQNLVSVHFLSRNLGNYLLHERPGMLFFIFNPEAIGVLVAHDLNEGEFVLQIPYYPPQQNLEEFTAEKCQEIIFKLVGHKLVDINIRDIKPWVMHAEVAEKYSAVNNRVILVGDAAHRFPPAGGFGMNTGIQDAHNLAWKIACVMHGIASSAILDTYEMERRPIALFNTALSIENFNDAMSVPSALGLNPNIANSGKIISSFLKIFAFLYQSSSRMHAFGHGSSLVWWKLLLEGIFTVGRAQLLPAVLNEANPFGSARLAKLRGILEEGKSLQLQFPAEDLGFRYLEGALITNADRNPEERKVKFGGRRKEYIPTAEVGARLPHMNLHLLDASSPEETLSTLDLVRGDRVEFLLLVGPRRASYSLASAALKVAVGIRLPLRVCIVWSESFSHQCIDDGRKLLQEHSGSVIEVQIKKTQASSSWWELVSRGAILVRPDDHIAWQVSLSESIQNPALEFERVFSQLMRLRKTKEDSAENEQ
ncbi:hypothetical protein EJ110_NYTH28182 [Nymphaea thermarum]|nr:hypothetical protein EJ110_NYTH28182 [Nymphaea thermarum]